tara:strand:+ start:6608 stop:6850 length:243 start_codon:yes stop_codon:yes gene_type:complete
MNNESVNPGFSLDPRNAEDVKCDICENLSFLQVYRIKRFSPLLTPNGEELFIPVQLFKCDSCGHINKNFLEHARMSEEPA